MEPSAAPAPVAPAATLDLVDARTGKALGTVRLAPDVTPADFAIAVNNGRLSTRARGEDDRPPKTIITANGLVSAKQAQAAAAKK